MAQQVEEKKALMSLLVLGVMLSAAAAVAAQPAVLEPHSAEFLAFAARYGKRYCGHSQSGENAVCEESMHREKVFWENKRFIEEYNAKHSSHQLGINAFADLTRDEFKEQNLCNSKPGGLDNVNTLKFEDNGIDSVPTSVDWRKDGLVTPVKNQGGCGACWAFAAVAGIEGAYAKATDRLISLSEQELVDCDEGSNGCDGGYFQQAFQWVINNGGLNSELHYPYTASDSQPCAPVKEKQHEAYISGIVQVEHLNETQLMMAVAKQPVSISIQADHQAFQFYKDGIFDSECGGTDLDHAAAIVGYDGEGDSSYWIMKNSWTVDWGEEGYMRIKRGTNQCGLATNPAYPVTNIS